MATSSKIKIATIISFALFMYTNTARVVDAQMPNVYEQTTQVNAFVGHDFDEDGMPNWWEIQYGLDPLDPSDAPLDYDGDTLTNLVEYQYLTSPINKDTDGGGVWDNLELELCNSPLDSSNDNDGDNCVSTFDPDVPVDPRADSDGDGLNNNIEDEIGTSKTSIDTDGDGVNDYDEVNKYPTNPLEPDTDFDGINDYDELFTYNTNPNNKDSDFDGLLDNEEIFTYNTNPNYWDSDDGGMSDKDELENGSDPLIKDDDYVLTWAVYYGNTAEEAFGSLENNKINIYEGMDLSLEAVRPKKVSQLTIKFNGKTFNTKKELVKLKLLSPDKPGIYKIDLALDLKTGKKITLTKFVEVRQRGKIISKIDGKFNSLYNQVDVFESEPVENAKIEVYEYNELCGELQLYQANILGASNPEKLGPNPQYTDSDGTYLLPLRPGNYLIKISKPEYGTQEILYNAETHTVFSQDIYLRYDYDIAIWGGIYLITFLTTWLVVNIINNLKSIFSFFFRRPFGKRKRAYN